MQDLVIEFLKQVNIVQLAAIGVMIWFFYNRLDHKIDRLDHRVDRTREDLKQEIVKLDHKIDRTREDLKQEIVKLDHKIDRTKGDLKQEIGQLGHEVSKLADKVVDIDRRLCRIEGSLSSHGHCLFNQAKPEQKAQ